MNVALVYDRVNKFGGAERVLQALLKIWPDAPLYTAVYDAQKAHWAEKYRIIPSFLQHIPFAKTHHEWLASLTSMAFETFSFDEYDLVITVTSGDAKGIITKPGTKHLCYCLTPTRYLWTHHAFYAAKPGFGLGNALAKLAFTLTGPVMRMWDQIAARRPDRIIAISHTVAKRVAKYYHCQAEVIYPPVRTDFFTPASGKVEEFYLVVSRLVPYKHIELILQAAAELKKKIIIVGNGSQLSSLQNTAQAGTKFITDADDVQLRQLYRTCKALIVASNEDFGITAVEAQACGKPVIAYGYGGYAETVLEPQTGIFFYEHTVEAIKKAFRTFEKTTFDAYQCRKNAEQFSEQSFISAINKNVQQMMG